MFYTRRELGKLVLAAVPAAAILERRPVHGQTAKPDSRWAGVQVGLNVPYSFGNNLMSADETLSRTVQLGVSAMELRSQPVEAFLGAPAPVAAAGRGATPEQVAAQRGAQAAAVEALKKWRASASVDGARAFRKKYEDAGVKIEILKFDNVYTMSDAELDWAFNLGKTLGARALSCEIATGATALDNTKRVGQFADKHQLMVGYHGHAETTPEHWEHAFAQAKFNGANLDIGHFLAGSNTSPVPFLKQYHDRITHIHVKDRKLNNGPNTPFGEGDTPIKEVLQTIRDNKWPIQATIEFEYKVPEGSDRMAEIAKAVAYCKAALLS